MMLNCDSTDFSSDAFRVPRRGCGGRGAILKGRIARGADGAQVLTHSCQSD
jgi:hypothetical protein